MEYNAISQILSPFAKESCPFLLGIGIYKDGSILGPWTIFQHMPKNSNLLLSYKHFFGYPEAMNISRMILAFNGCKEETSEATFKSKVQEVFNRMTTLAEANKSGIELDAIIFNQDGIRQI